MNITKGVIEKAKKVIIYGPEGIGKSTFASMFPDPIFVDTEGSTSELDVTRLDKPSSWQMLLQMIDYIIQSRPCKSIVIDTADWAERLCTESVCSAHGKKGVEDFGYGNGYTYIAEEWGRFLNRLQDVVDIADINVILTAHAIIRKFEQPNEMGAYDRYELKLGKKTTAQTAPLTKEWADMVLFANYKTFSVATDDKGKKHKAQGGQRVMYTTHHPCWDAKNRFNLQEELPFDYSEIAHIFTRSTSPQLQQSTQVKPLDITDGVDTGPHDYTIDTPINQALENDFDRLPDALIDLMKSTNVSEKQIRMAVSSKGYFPLDMPVKEYPREFIDSVLVSAWDQVYQMIIDETVPF